MKYILLALLLSGCAYPECNCIRSNVPCQEYGFKAEHDKICEQEALKKCGPNGAVDWDENPKDPPPHCG